MLLAASLISGSIAAQAVAPPSPVSVSISGVSVTEPVAVYNGGDATATVTDSTVTVSSAASTKGVDVYSDSGDATATVTNSTVTASTTGNAATAKGVYAASYYADATATVTNSTITASTSGAASDAIGVFVNGWVNGMTIGNSTIRASTTGAGSNAFGISAFSYYANNMTISNSTITGSTAGDNAGAFGIQALSNVGDNTLTITGSTISAATIGNNSGATLFASAVSPFTINGNNTVTITGSTITASTTGVNEFANGVKAGSILGNNTLAITNSTITATATGAGTEAAGIRADSGADGNTITLVNSTVTGSDFGIYSDSAAVSTISIDRTSTVSSGDYAIKAISAGANVTVSGLVSGRLNVKDLTTASTATLRANFDTARDNTLISENPYFNILGTATLANGTTFNIHPANNLLAPGASETYYLLYSGNPSAWTQANLNLTYGPLMNVSWAVAGVTDLAVTVAVKDFTTLAGSGLSGNGFAALQDLYNNNPARFDINGNPETWLPDSSGAAVTGMIGMQGGASSLISHHLQQVASTAPSSGAGNEGSGVNTGDPTVAQGFWGEVWYTDAKQDTRDGINGFDAKTVNLTFGYDHELADGSRLGLAFTRGDSNADTKNTANGVDSISHIFTLYGKHAFGPWQTQAAISAGVANNDAVRYADSERITAAYDSTLYGANVVAGYLIGDTGAWRLQPQAAVNYSHVAIDGYSENGDGTGTSKALRVQSQDYDVFEVGAGVNVQRQFKIGTGILRPEAEIMVYRDLVGDQIEATSSFIGGNTSFVTRGSDPAQTSWKLDLGLNYDIENNLSFRVGYNYTGRDDFEANSVNAKLRYEF